MSKLNTGEEFAIPAPDDTSFFSTVRGNVIVKLKSGDTVRPMGGTSTPPEFKAK